MHLPRTECGVERFSRATTTPAKRVVLVVGDSTLIISSRSRSILTFGSTLQTDERFASRATRRRQLSALTVGLGGDGCLDTLKADYFSPCGR